MNIKYKMINALGKNVYCVISGNADKAEAFKNLFDFAPGGGYSVEIESDKIRIIDYFGGSTVATFKILSVEDTDDSPTDRFIEII